MQEFSSILKSLIESRGINQKWLADKAGTTEATISRYINGIHQPQMSVVIAIAKALDVSIDYLCGLTSMPGRKADHDDDELLILIRCYNRVSDRDKKLLWGILEDYMSPGEKAKFNQSSNASSSSTQTAG